MDVKPCPDCGSLHFDIDTLQTDGIHVTCRECGKHLGPFATVLQAITAWNAESGLTESDNSDN